MVKSSALTDKAILTRWLDAARRFASRKSDFISFSETTLWAEHYLLQNGDIRHPFLNNAQLKKMRRGLNAAISQGCPAYGKGLTVDKAGRSKIINILLNTNEGWKSAGTGGYNNFRGDIFRDSAKLLVAAKSLEIECSDLSRSRLSRTIGINRKRFKHNQVHA